MRALDLPNFLRRGASVLPAHQPGGGFRLMRYVVVTSLIALVFFMLLMYFTEHLEESFFAEVQRDQLTFFEEAQHDFMREHDQTRQAEILKVHEAGHVNLAHVFANMLWDQTFSPLVQKAQRVPIEDCRAVAAAQPGAQVSTEQQACFAKVRQALMALPHFSEIDAKVRATMHKSSVFKIKVFDTRGLTVYSSENAQVGEDKAGNQGWKTAAGGQTASELTHRERFSAFEGVVEDRDLISSYIPILTESQQLQGVFEIYSDATPFLKASDEASAVMAQRIANNRATASQVARKNLNRITTNNGYAQMISATLFALFYAALLLIVFNGQRILDQHVLAQEQANERERFWYREKMTALATMAANVSHEVGNPLATISALAQDMEGERRQHGCAGCQPAMILEQTDRIANMTRQIVNFATVRDQESEPINVNQMVLAACDFLGFDHRFRAVQIKTRLADNLPARVVIPDHLNEALMVVLQSCLEKCLQSPTAQQRVLVATLEQDQSVLIRISFDESSTVGMNTPLTDHAFKLAHRRLHEMGGKLLVSQEMVEISLPEAMALDASHPS
jgi:nitrogen-specific signal transduction histidine kinase